MLISSIKLTISLIRIIESRTQSKPEQNVESTWREGGLLSSVRWSSNKLNANYRIKRQSKSNKMLNWNDKRVVIIKTSCYRNLNLTFMVFCLFFYFWIVTIFIILAALKLKILIPSMVVQSLHTMIYLNLMLYLNFRGRWHCILIWPIDNLIFASVSVDFFAFLEIKKDLLKFNHE